MNTTVSSPRLWWSRAWVRVEERSTLAAGCALALVSLLAAVLLYRKGLGTTFYLDEWNFVMNRRDWDVDTFLRPHAEHFSLVPILIFKLLFVTVGLDSYAVYRVLLIVAHLVVVAEIFELVRRRLGDWLGLAAAVLILFIGAAWHDLLVPFQLSFVISVAAGLGAFLALERRDTLGDWAASALLALGLASSSIGIPFAAAVLVETVAGPRRLRGLWITLVPLALYGLWSLEYGDPTASAGGRTLEELIRMNGPGAPNYVATAVAGAAGAVIGIGVDWGRPLALIGGAVLALRLARGSVTPRLLGLITAGVTFWGLTAVFRAHINPPLDSRYLYLGAIVVVLIAVELIRPVSVAPRLAIVTGVLVAAAALANFGPLRDGSRYLQDSSRYLQVELAALELAGPSADPSYVPDPVRAPDVTAGKYFAAIDQYGSPAASPDEIPLRPEPERAAADGVLVRALGTKLVPLQSEGTGPRPQVESASGQVVNTSACAALSAQGAPVSLDVLLPPEGVSVSGGPAPLEVRLRSYADGFPESPLVTLPPGRTWALRVPARRDLRWHVRLSGNGTLRACGLADS